MGKINRIVIESILIKNFRSIRNEHIEAKDLNILVGLNDVGKSNVLKALNLFFNGETEYGVPFEFKRDFSYLFPKKSHMTKEIVVELKIYIPDSYKNPGTYIWKKVWRTGDYMTEMILNEKGEKPSNRSRVPGTLKRIKYRYVPAVKSKEYYRSLLAELYLTTASTLGNPLVSSMEKFSEVIQNYTKNIHDEVFNRVGIDSKLSIPDNLSETFKTLVFQTSLKDSDMVIPLDMRGDGIQARHIPIILKYIANQDQNTRTSGSMKITTIWGFEEPENGVELSKCFAMADEFMEYSTEIQIFVTTHSPAFYMKKDDDNCKVLYVTQKNEGTSIKNNIQSKDIGEIMGLLPIVAPYIAEQEEKINEVKKLLINEPLMDIPTIFVEGKTDKLYIEMAIKAFSPQLSELLEKEELRVYTKPGEGGCVNLINLIYAWVYSGNLSKAVALFDKDDAGIKAKNELVNSEIYRTKNTKAMVNVQFLEPSDEIIELKKLKLELPFEIEHLLSVECWEQLTKKKLVEKRKIQEIAKFAGKNLKYDMTIEESLSEIILDKKLLETIVMLNPHTYKKEKICDYVKNSSEEEQRQWLSGFKRTIEKLETIFTR